jgi:membrane protein insertase Oxa1/YidC/SpoIIIJ
MCPCCCPTTNSPPPSSQAYGPTIILFTILLKALTFPLNKQQIESTTKMQAIQPAAKALQVWEQHWAQSSV